MRKIELFRWLKCAGRGVVAVAALVLILNQAACKKEEAIGPLTLVSLQAGTVNLLHPNPTSTIDPTLPVLAVFSTDIDPATVTPTAVVMTRDYDLAAVPLVLILTRSELSIKSTGDLLSGASYTLQITSDLKNLSGEAFGSVTVKFNTSGGFVPANVIAYWSFEKSPLDIIGTLDPDPNLDVTDITYVPSRNSTAGYAASFNGTTSAIQTPSATTLFTPEVTLTFWMYLNSDNHTTTSGKIKSSYVMGLGNYHGLSLTVDSSYQYANFEQGYILQNNATLNNDFNFTANGILKGDPAAGTGIENATLVNQNFEASGIRALLDKRWVHIAMTFKDTVNIRSLYINGDLMYQQDLTLLNNSSVDASLQPLATVATMKYIPDISIPATYDDRLTFGFWQSKESTFGGASSVYTNPDANHFQGLLDDVRFFNRALTPEEIKMMFDAENTAP